MKYFFLSAGWTVGRVWATDGLWQVTAWRRSPEIQQLDICLVEKNELLWLYRVEPVVVMVEVKPMDNTQLPVSKQTIGQVILRRLMSAEQVIEHLGKAAAKCQLQNLNQLVL
ncbi:MAG: hypothetical protein QNJ51_30875 [Calothrix sp. MO_167.B12]|nr:hypothetical protein [Calothrix sp. MO_167.B12]